ncbi:MAG: M23 family metallopeptidase, partial [Spirochaetia bacterium]|nr:M23 family metallopeptidase [Spirochaetia bacterium]
AVLILGIIITASISSSAFIPPAEFNLPRDNGVDIMMEAALVKSDASDEKAFGDVDMSLLKGLKIREHKIVTGESLSTIAGKYKIDLGTLISFNNIKNARKINSGTIIKIPDKTGLFYKVSKGDSLGSIASKFNIELNALLDINNIDSYLIKPGQELFIPEAKMDSFDLKKALGELFLYPVSGRLTSPFGYRKDPFTGKRMMHYGMDISNYTGTKVRATLDGKVLMCSYSSVYGKYVIIKHQDGYQSLYAHLDKYRVYEGENVVQGQIIGDLGNTGRSTGPHLHFSIYHKQKPIDPATVLSSR